MKIIETYNTNKTKFSAVIDRLMKYFNLTQSKDLSEQLGVNYATFSTWIRRDKIPYELLVDLCLKENISLDWLLAGIKNDNLYAIDHDATYFTIVGQNGRILVRDNFSTPGSTTWMDFFSNSNWGNLTDVFFNGTNSIIVGSAGRVVTGTAENGFSSRGAITSLDLFSVSGSGNSLIAVGQDGIIYHSSNGGTSWRAGIQSTEFTLMDIHYDLELNEIFTVGDRGTMQFGTDKIN